MAKSAPSISLQQALVESAALSGAVSRRSPSEQIEYWADIGRKVARAIDQEDLLAAQAGFARIKVEKVEPPDVDPQTVFASFDAARESGALTAALAEISPLRYQASKTRPGLLERIDETGKVTVGRFLGGEFRPVK